MPAKTHYIFVFFGIYAHFAGALVGFCELVQPWNVIGVPRVSESHIGGGKYIPFVKGGLGVLHQENFLIQYICKSDYNTF